MKDRDSVVFSRQSYIIHSISGFIFEEDIMLSCYFDVFVMILNLMERHFSPERGLRSSHLLLSASTQPQVYCRPTFGCMSPLLCFMYL